MQEPGHPTRPAMRAAVLTIAAVMTGIAAAPVPTAAQQSTASTGGVLEKALESRAKGGDSATVVVFEIADFQCPYCARFSEEVAPAIHDQYVATGQVQWVFVNLPLHNHPLAWHAAEAALCAGVAGDQFWPMHDRLFAEQQTWGEADDPHALFARYAADLGIPEAEFGTCTANDEVAPLILQDLGSVVSAGINGTPTFIIMRGQQVVDRVVGLETVEEWRETLEGALGGDAGRQ